MADIVSQADIDALETGVDQALARIEALLKLEAFAEDIPIVGEQLDGMFEKAQGMLNILTDLKTKVIQGLNTINNIESVAANQVQATIQNALDSALGPYASLVTAAVTGGDVQLVFNSSSLFSSDFDLGDLGMSGLGLNMSGKGSASLDHNFRITVGVDGGSAANFYLDTGSSFFNFGADLSLNNAAVETSLGFLNFSATNIDDNDPSATADTANFDFSTSWNTLGRVRLDNLSSDLLNVSMSGNVDLDIHLAANMGTAVLPNISADLKVDWSFNQNILNGTGANNWGAATVTFENVEYSFGSFVDQFITPILEQIDPILQPINDALAVFRTDISGVLLPDWIEKLDVIDDDQVTVLDFMQLASNFAKLNIDFAPLAQFVDLVDSIVDVVEFFRGRSFDDAGYDVGNYQFQLQQIQGAVDTLSSLNLNAGTFTSQAQDLTTFLGGLGGLGGFGDTHEGQTGTDILGSLVNNNWLAFPMIENPISVIQLLLGQDVDLFRLDMPTINIGMGMDAAGNITNPITALSLPVWPVPLVTANVNIAMQAVIDLAFGYDTSGLKQYAINEFDNPLLIFNGFYLDDQRNGSTDIAEFVFRAAVEIALDANFAVVSAGGAGNIIGEIALNFADNLFGSDGKLYVNELPNDLLTNPFQIFDISGKITAGVRFYVNSIFGNHINWSPARIPLVDFSIRQGAASDAPPPGLGDQSDSVLWINIGARAGERDITDKRGDAGEYFEIVGGNPGIVAVSAFGESQIFGQTTGVTSIELDGSGGNDEVVANNTVGMAIRASGGAGYDYLSGGGGGDKLYGGTEDDWLAGNDGQDELHGEDGNDYLEGGEGGDLLNGGGGGYDTATYVGAGTGITLNFTTGVHTGDAEGDLFAAIEVFEGSRKNDILIGGASADIFTGVEGDDQLAGMGGDDILAGGPGVNILNGGDGYDIANYYFAGTGVTVTFSNAGGTVTAGPADARTIDDTLSNIEQVDGSELSDTMIGGAGGQVFVGAAGADWLHGGADNDMLLGSEGGDTLIGGDGEDAASYVTAAAGVTANLANGGTGGDAAGDSYQTIENLTGSDHNDSLTGDAQANFIYGGSGTDTIGGGGGDDTIEGGIGADSLNGGDGTDRASYLNAAGAILIDLVTGERGGDATGDSYTQIEIYQGSRFGDTIRGSASGETLRGEAGMDDLRGGGGNDTLIGGLDSDSLWGGDNDDSLQGSEGNDTLRGEAGLDVLHGGDGADLIDGGSERDRVTYFDSGSGARVNLSNTAHVLGSVSIAALTANDGRGSLDTFTAGGTGRSSVEDATGSNLADWLVASEAGSKLYGLGGADDLLGLEGDDELKGEAGADKLVGGAGKDIVNGGAGADSLDGGAGAEDMASYEDDAAGVTASLTALQATDGSGATDTLLNIEGLRGSAHADSLTGNGGVNRIEGGAGNDTLDGKAGADVLVGGDGDDIYFVDSVLSATGPTPDQVVETSGGGHDIIKTSVNYGSLNFVVPLADEVEDLQLLGLVVFGYGNSQSNRLIGNATSNVLDGRQGGDTFWGYAGNDLYYFDGWGDSVGTAAAPRSGFTAAGEVANGGTDEIRLATTGLTAVNTSTTYSLDESWAQQVENLVLLDNDRNISITGNARDNHLVANSHSQTLNGGDGADRLDVRSGRDTAHGGAGSDTLVFDWATSGDWYDTNSLSGSLATGYGGELRNYYNYGHGVWFTGIEHFDLTLGNGWDNVNTGDGNDRVIGNDGRDYLYTRAGADVIDGGAEADRWVADKSAATAGMNINLAVLSTYQIGGLTGSVQNVEALGVADAASDRFQSGLGNDTIVTHVSYHDDWIRTNAGDDSVKLFAGHDRANLGTGNDTLVIDWSPYDDSMDVSELAGNLTDGYSGVYRNYYSYDNGAYFAGAEHFDVRLGSGWDTLRTGDGNDKVSGGAGNDHLITARGVDIIDGGSGDDRWTADKSKDASNVAIAQAFVLDLTNDASVIAGKPGPQSAYLGSGTVRGIEMLTLSTGEGDDVITTLAVHHNDQITTNGGSDWVKVAGGHDTVAMGGQGAAGDTLVVDWSYHDDASNFPSLTAALDGSGYSGEFRNYYWYDGAVIFSGVEHFDLKLTKGWDYVITGIGNDVIAANDGDDYLVTDTGADVIDGGAGNDRWFADKSAATAGMTIDLAALSTYQIGTLGGSVKGIEALGNSEAERFQSGSGDDVIATHAIYNNDWIRTNAGNDSVSLFAGHDRVDLGAGNDTLVIDWTTSDDAYDTSEISGSLAAGYSGQLRNYYSYDNGAYFAGVEHFNVKLGTGWDTLRTGDGNDIVWANAGNDNLITGRGVDIVDGGIGADRWQADKSKDGGGVTITQAIVVDLTNDPSVSAARTGPQSTYLGTGSVRGIEMLTLTTGEGNDKITTLYAHHDDQLTTNGGSDWVKVAGGHDTVTMGFQGALGDTLVVDWSAYTDGSNNPGLALANDGTGYWGQFRNYYWYGASVTFSGVEHFDMKLTQGGDHIITGNGNDTIAGNEGDDYLVTAGGADVISGGTGADRWLADKAAATAAVRINLAVTSSYEIGGLTGSVEGIEALGYAEGERFQTGSGNDVIVTHAGHYDDWLRTNAGNDSVKLIRGHDRVDMGAGSDTLVIDWSHSPETYNISSLGGALATGYFGEFRNYYGYGHGAYFAGVEHFDATLGSGSDTLHTGDGHDKVAAGAGDDYFNSRGGADTIDGGAGIDRWNADKSAATSGMTINLNAASSKYTIAGQTVTVQGVEALGGSNTVGDRFRSGSGNDTIVTRGEGYEDFIETLGGNDTIKIAGGHDRIHGDDGFDTLFIDWSASGETYDTNWISGSLAAGYAGELRNYYGYGNGAYFTGIERFNVRLGSGSDTFTSGDGNDIIQGGGGADTLRAGGGVDTIDYSDKTLAVAVALNGASDVGAFVNGSREDTISGFENVTGGSGADTITGDAGANVLAGGAGDDLIEGGGGNDRLNGGIGKDTVSYASATARVVVSLSSVFDQDTSGAGIDSLGDFENVIGSAYNDRLTGTVAANVINGGAGADTMIGGAGNDTYFVDHANDQVQEGSAANGVDVVQSSVTFTLGAYVEHLVLTGNAAINGIGNDLANILAGNGAANVLNGGTGADTMRGGLGDDRYNVDDALDKVEELANAGTDTVNSSVGYALTDNVETLVLTGLAAISGTGNALNNLITGNAAANIIHGGAGNDRIDGGAGADHLTGGLGNDVLIVDHAGDVIVEASGGGIDSVESSVTYALSAEIENLKLTGALATHGTGNASANALTGNGAANVLNGLGGADTMTGGAGDDTYVVDNAGDKAVEASGAGVDLVESSVSFTLDTHVENLTLTGTGAVNGTGNSAGNVLTGNSGANALTGSGGADTIGGGVGNDKLYGGDGLDKLTGGAGADGFYFDTAFNAASNVDAILDFAAVDDTIFLNRSIFTGITVGGTLSAAAFVTGTAAADSSDRIVYDQATGKIFYDADGNGAGAAVLFATVTAGTVLTNADFSAYLA